MIVSVNKIDYFFVFLFCFLFIDFIVMNKYQCLGGGGPKVELIVKIVNISLFMRIQLVNRQYKLGMTISYYIIHHYYITKKQKSDDGEKNKRKWNQY